MGNDHTMNVDLVTRLKQFLTISQFKHIGFAFISNTQKNDVVNYLQNEKLVYNAMHPIQSKHAFFVDVDLSQIIVSNQPIRNFQLGLERLKLWRELNSEIPIGFILSTEPSAMIKNQWKVEPVCQMFVYDFVDQIVITDGKSIWDYKTQAQLETKNHIIL